MNDACEVASISDTENYQIVWKQLMLLDYTNFSSDSIREDCCDEIKVKQLHGNKIKQK